MSNMPEPVVYTPNSEAAEQFVAPVPTQPLEPAPVDETVSWTASEFIAHEKTGLWYGAVCGASVLLAIILAILTHDKVTGIVVGGAGLLLAFYGSRQPRQLQYQAGHGGVRVGDKFYPYADFHSFSVVADGAFASIVFMPLKRFSPGLTIYYAPEDEDRLLSLIGDHLPYEQHEPDAVDRLMKKIRF